MIAGSSLRRVDGSMQVSATASLCEFPTRFYPRIRGFSRHFPSLTSRRCTKRAFMRACKLRSAAVVVWNRCKSHCYIRFGGPMLDENIVKIRKNPCKFMAKGFRV